MSIEDILAQLNKGDHTGWVCYQDGSWALLGSDGWPGPSITPCGMLGAVRRDVAALEAAGLIADVIDAEPLSVIDLDDDDPIRRDPRRPASNTRGHRTDDYEEQLNDDHPRGLEHHHPQQP
ncbi:hypothetical protein ACFV4K_02730 [Nocardia sp. NPDC059764]|uniref:hypothetical protein n=1 Tax=Nocardia sp. NPDC059764 TaxID=3346939 RepID=UPI003653B444